MAQNNTTIKKSTMNTIVSSADKKCNNQCQIKERQQSNGADFGRMLKSQQSNNDNCCRKSLHSCWLLQESSGFRWITLWQGGPLSQEYLEFSQSLLRYCSLGCARGLCGVGNVISPLFLFDGQIYDDAVEMVMVAIFLIIVIIFYLLTSRPSFYI